MIALRNFQALEASARGFSNDWKTGAWSFQ